MGIEKMEVVIEMAKDHQDRDGRGDNIMEWEWNGFYKDWNGKWVGQPVGHKTVVGLVSEGGTVVGITSKLGIDASEKWKV